MSWFDFHLTCLWKTFVMISSMKLAISDRQWNLGALSLGHKFRIKRCPHPASGSLTAHESILKKPQNQLFSQKSDTNLTEMVFPETSTCVSSVAKLLSVCLRSNPWQPPEVPVVTNETDESISCIDLSSIIPEFSSFYSRKQFCNSDGNLASDSGTSDRPHEAKTTAPRADAVDVVSFHRFHKFASWIVTMVFVIKSSLVQGTCSFALQCNICCKKSENSSLWAFRRRIQDWIRGARPSDLRGGGGLQLFWACCSCPRVSWVHFFYRRSGSNTNTGLGMKRHGLCRPLVTCLLNVWTFMRQNTFSAESNIPILCHENCVSGRPSCTSTMCTTAATVTLLR